MTGYTVIAAAQLEQLESHDDIDLYNAVLDAVDLIFAAPDLAQARSSAITTDHGIVLRLAVVGYPHKIFWTSQGPRIEAIFPYST